MMNDTKTRFMMQDTGFRI